MKNTREGPGNYRPLSLTLIPGKIMEITLVTTERHLKDNTIIKPSQHRFTKEKSCLSDLISFHDKITCLVDKGKAADIFFWILLRLLILSPHSILLHKLSNCEMSKYTLHWMMNWLHGRPQRLVVNGAASGWQLITSGVPQGSVLGLFFTFLSVIWMQEWQVCQ